MILALGVREELRDNPLGEAEHIAEDMVQRLGPEHLLAMLAMPFLPASEGNSLTIPTYSGGSQGVRAGVITEGPHSVLNSTPPAIPSHPYESVVAPLPPSVLSWGCDVYLVVLSIWLCVVVGDDEDFLWSS